MNELITAVPYGLAAFVATNIDDILILTLLFAQVNAMFRHLHIVVGQYLGFSLLLLASLPGFFGSQLVPAEWIRLLGIVPIVIGLWWCLSKPEEEDDTESVDLEVKDSFFSRLLSPQTYGVAAITVANGSDNIGVYVPLFANSNLTSLSVILVIFLLMVGVWCYAAYKLTNLTAIAQGARPAAIAQILTGYGNTFVPCVLIGLGVFIVKESIVLTLISFACSLLWVITIGRQEKQAVEKHS